MKQNKIYKLANYIFKIFFTLIVFTMGLAHANPALIQTLQCQYDDERLLREVQDILFSSNLYDNGVAHLMISERFPDIKNTTNMTYAVKYFDKGMSLVKVEGVPGKISKLRSKILAGNKVEEINGFWNFEYNKDIDATHQLWTGTVWSPHKITINLNCTVKNTPTVAMPYFANDADKSSGKKTAGLITLPNSEDITHTYKCVYENDAYNKQINDLRVAEWSLKSSKDGLRMAIGPAGNFVPINGPYYLEFGVNGLISLLQLDQKVSGTITKPRSTGVEDITVDDWAFVIHEFDKVNMQYKMSMQTNKVGTLGKLTVKLICHAYLSRPRTLPAGDSDEKKAPNRDDVSGVSGGNTFAVLKDDVYTGLKCSVSPNGPVLEWKSKKIGTPEGFTTGSDRVLGFYELLSNEPLSGNPVMGRMVGDRYFINEIMFMPKGKKSIYKLSFESSTSIQGKWIIERSEGLSGNNFTTVDGTCEDTVSQAEIDSHPQLTEKEILPILQ